MYTFSTLPGPGLKVTGLEGRGKGEREKETGWSPSLTPVQVSHVPKAILFES